MARQINEYLLQQIDGLELGDRIKAWQAALKSAPSRIFVDRQRLALESWKTTEGEDIQIRRAKLFKHIVDNVPIKILDFDVIVGRPTPGVIGACTAIDACGDYMPGIWEENDVQMTVTNYCALTGEDRDCLRESAAYFRGKTVVDKCNEAWREVLGNWPADYEEARGKDPILNTGIFPGSTSAVLFDKILSKGLRSIIDEAKENIGNFTARQQTGIDRVIFWKSSIMALEACIDHAHRYADLAGQMAAVEQNPTRAAELKEIARICRRVPEFPAETLQEALQSMAIVGVCKYYEHPVQNFPQWARGDQYLYPYFMRDLERGAVPLEKAAELIEELIARWGTQIFVGSVTNKETHQVNFGINNLTLTGVDKNGDDASNELSYLFLHVVGLLKLSAPTVTFRWNKNSPAWLMKKAIETNMQTKGGIPLFQNDEHVIECFVRDGIPLGEASDWYGLGCVYPCLPTRAEHSGSEGVGAMNVVLVLDLVLHNGVSAITGKKVGLETGDPRSFKSFDDLYDAFKKQWKFVVTRNFWLARIARETSEKYLRFPFLSSILTQGCMDAGKDVLCSDPSFAVFGLHDRALIDTSDSLIALKKLIFEEKKLTMDELLQALDSNFAGVRGEQIRRICLAAPKFGNDIEAADLMARDVSSFTAGVIRSYNDAPYKGYMVCREGLSWHFFGGLGVGALPNGRKSREPLNDGSISPMRGVDLKGPTAVIRSVLKAGFDESHASVLNQKFSSSIVQSADSREKLRIYADTFLRNGGQHIQFNLVNAEELRDAKAHPEQHQDLIVRIGGFSAYFVQLSPEIQDDVINRTEHAL